MVQCFVFHLRQFENQGSRELHGLEGEECVVGGFGLSLTLVRGRH